MSATQTSVLTLSDTQADSDGDLDRLSIVRPKGQASVRETTKSADFIAPSGSESRRDSEYDPVDTQGSGLREVCTSARVDYDFPSATRGEHGSVGYPPQRGGYHLSTLGETDW